MTVEQPREDLNRVVVKDAINVIRLLNLALSDPKISEQDRKRLAKFLEPMFQK
jgi:hypothetical protein